MASRDHLYRKRLQGLHFNNLNTDDVINNLTTSREKELLQKLVEASDEIETLQGERDRLLTLSNDLKAKLQCDNAGSRQINASLGEPRYNKEVTMEDNQVLVSAILDDLSRSCDGESIPKVSDDKAVVACFGTKHSLSSAADFTSSENGYPKFLKPMSSSARATASQNESFQRLTNQNMKRDQIQRSKGGRSILRNWNSGY